MSNVKKKSQNTKFLKEWTDKYLFVLKDGKPLCMVCYNSLSNIKKSNIERHFRSKHLAQYINKSVEDIKNEAKILLENLNTSKLNLNVKPKDLTTESGNKFNCRVAELIATKMKPFTDGKIIFDALTIFVEEFFPNRKEILNNVSLSPRTLCRKMENLSDDIKYNLQEKLKNCEFYSLALDETTDISDMSQLCIFIRSINYNNIISEDLLKLCQLKKSTKGVDIFNECYNVIKEYGLDLKKLTGITTDGAPNMTGSINGFKGVLTKKLKENNVNNVYWTHCIIHQESLCSRIFNNSEVINQITTVINYIRSSSLRHREFKLLLDEIETNCDGVLFYTEIRWLSRGAALKRVWDLQDSIRQYLSLKNKSGLLPNEKPFNMDFGFLCDISHKLNELNLKLQGKHKLIHNLYKEVVSFIQK